MPKDNTKTITFSRLRRLSFCNSKDLPHAVNLNGERHTWVGIGWLNEGELEGDEVLVVNDEES